MQFNHVENKQNSILYFKDRRTTISMATFG